MTEVFYLIMIFGVINASCPMPEKKKRCMISARSGDGIGHQIDGKLSCIAVAIELGYEYIHYPIGGADHIHNGAAMETFLNLGNCFRKFDKDTMRLESTKRWPWVGPCDDKSSWFNRAYKNQSADCTLEDDPTILYIGDNCWDQFWCRTIPQNSKLWYDKVLPIVQTSYYSTPKPDNHYVSTDINVAVHIRRGDAPDRALDDEYYVKAMLLIQHRYRDMLSSSSSSSNTKKTGLKFWIHTDMKKEDSTHLSHYEHHDLNIEWCFEGTSSIEEVIHQIVTSDIFILSRSGFSYGLAL
jgi:hypothetical protein